MEGDRGPNPQDDSKANRIAQPAIESLSLTAVSDKGSVAGSNDAASLAAKQLEYHRQKTDGESYLARLFNPLCKDGDSSQRLETALSMYRQASSRLDISNATRVLNEAIDADQKALRRKEEISGYGCGFLKSLALFSNSKLATAAVYAFDQANPHDGLNLQLADGVLGASKGYTLNYIFKEGASRDLSVAEKAITLGVGSRAADTLLSRKTYFDQSGNASLSHAFDAARTNIANPTLLASDIAFFGLAHGLVKGSNFLSRGMIESNPLYNSVATAGSFGLIAGSNAEVKRQMAEGRTYANLDLLSVLKSGGIQGGLDLVAGVPGGMRGAHELRSARSESNIQPQAEPVSTWPERGVMARVEFEQLAPQGKSDLPPIWDFKDRAMQYVYDNSTGVKAAVRSPLKEFEPIDDFAGRIVSETGKWQGDLTAAKLDVDLKKMALREHQDIMQSELIDKDVVRVAHILQYPAQVRELLAQDPVRMSMYADYLKAQYEHGQAHKLLMDQVDARMQGLNGAVNDFARTQGIPDAAFEKMFNSNGGAAATYKTGTGQIQLRVEDLLNSDKKADLGEHVYHEFTHLEQDATIIRRLADKLSVGVAPTQAQREAITASYRKETGGALEPEFLDRVMQTRNGVALSPEQAARADMLMESFLRNNPSSRFFVESRNDYRVVSNLLKTLEGQNGAYMAVSKIADGGPVYSRRLFGNTELPSWAQAQVDNLTAYEAGKNDGWLDTLPQVKDGLKAGFLARLDGINQARERAFADYMQPHEQEAWLLGRWAQLRTANWRATTGGEGDGF